MEKNKLVLIVPTIYFLLALFLLPNIGFGWDSSVNLVKGEQTFNFLRTFEKSYLVDGAHASKYFNEIPGIFNGHPPAFSFLVFLVGNFFSSLFGFKYYFFHIVNILLSTVFLYYLAVFVFDLIKIKSDSLKTYSGVLSQLLIISIPSFFIHSIVNIKDIPVAVFTFFSIFFLFKTSNKNINYFFYSIFFFLLALYTKLTALFIFPVILYLLYIKRKVLLKNSKTVLLSFPLLVLITTIFFWPHIIFNFDYEFARVKYFYLEISNVKEPHSFIDAFFSSLPNYLVLYVGFTLYMFFKYYKKVKGNLDVVLLLSLWFFVPAAYFFLSSKFYDGIRQFIFILIPLVVSISLSFVHILKKEKHGLNILILAVPFIFFIYQAFFYTPFQLTYKNYFFKNFPKADYWVLSVPSAVEKVENNLKDKKIHLVQAPFLLNYYELKNNTSVMGFYESDILITTTNNYWYRNSKEEREKNFEKVVFKEGRGVIEIWQRSN